MKILLTVSLVAAAMAASPAQGAGFYTGNDLAQLIPEVKKANAKDPSTSYMEATEFVAYVVGVHDSRNNIMFCSPSTVTRGQVSAVAMRYIENHPERLHLPGESLLTEALTEAFPCN